MAFKNQFKQALGHRKLVEIEQREIVSLQQNLAEEPCNDNGLVFSRIAKYQAEGNG